VLFSIVIANSENTHKKKLDAKGLYEEATILIVLTRIWLAYFCDIHINIQAE